MTALLNLMTERITVLRLSLVSGDRRAYSTLTTEYCNVQRMADEKAIGLGGAIGKMFRIYTQEDTDIQKGDRLIDANGNEYNVVGITIPASLGSFIHKEGVIEKVQ